MSQESTQLTDVGTIQPGACRAIPFVVAAAGPVSVVSIPHPVPLKNQTETGRLGHITLIRAGNPATVAASTITPIGAKQLALSYQSTQEDLAIAGMWTCRVCNDTLFPLQFNTTLTIPPIPTASFDVGLLNSMLALAASTADLRIHLQTTDDGSSACIASWSVALANLLPDTPIQATPGGPKIILKNAIETRFPLSTFDAFTVNIPVPVVDPIGDVTLADGHIINADSFDVTIGLSGESIVLTAAFDAANMKLTVSVPDLSIGITDVSFQVFQVELSIDFDGRVTLDAQVTASATIAGNFIDLSEQIREKLLRTIQDKLPSFLSDPAAVKKGLFSFFANLMRLNEIAVPNKDTPFFGQIQDVSVDGRTLVASYSLVPANTHTTS